MPKAFYRVIFLSCALGVSMLSWAAQQAPLTSEPAQEQFIAGKDYNVLPKPVVTRDKNKIEVVELFWYGCGHCYTFESIFKPWKQQQASDVDIIQMPAIWNKTMELHAKAYFTAQALEKLDDIHQPFFHALLEKRERLYSESAIQAFFARYGVDKETFTETFNSFGVNSQVALTRSRGKSYKMRGTPEVVVNGKYRISVSQVKSQEKVLEVASFLIEKERRLRQETTADAG